MPFQVLKMVWCSLVMHDADKFAGNVQRLIQRILVTFIVDNFREDMGSVSRRANVYLNLWRDYTRNQL